MIILTERIFSNRARRAYTRSLREMKYYKDAKLDKLDEIKRTTELYKDDPKTLGERIAKINDEYSKLGKGDIVTKYKNREREDWNKFNTKPSISASDPHSIIQNRVLGKNNKNNSVVKDLYKRLEKAKLNGNTEEVVKLTNKLNSVKNSVNTPYPTSNGASYFLNNRNGYMKYISGHV